MALNVRTRLNFYASLDLREKHNYFLDSQPFNSSHENSSEDSNEHTRNNIDAAGGSFERPSSSMLIIQDNQEIRNVPSNYSLEAAKPTRPSNHFKTNS